MILVRGPWHETLGSPDLPFTLNRSMSFPGVFKLWGLYVSVRLSFTFTYLIICFFSIGKSWRGKLVNWVEKASFKKIQKLLEISERERHQ